VAWKAGLAGIAVIAVGLLFRSVGTYLSLFGTDLNFKEKLFCVVAYILKATVQAAIGAVPLTAGVASGDLILAVAVLSIVLTAPVGALGIMVLGKRILHHGERYSYRFQDLREALGLPTVGERVRNRHYDTIWNVIEEKEQWIKAPGKDGSGGGGSELEPAILLRYWKENTNNSLGTGNTLYYRYSQTDPYFNRYWEILYDW
jgi:hypothetical protein